MKPEDGNSNVPDIFGKQFLVIYKDDKGKTRTKILILTGVDNSMFYFTNPKDKKSEILPKKAIKRMAEQDNLGHTTYTGNVCQTSDKKDAFRHKGIIPIVPKEELEQAEWRPFPNKDTEDIYNKTKRLL